MIWRAREVERFHRPDSWYCHIKCAGYFPRSSSRVYLQAAAARDCGGKKLLLRQATAQDAQIQYERAISDYALAWVALKRLQGSVK